MTREEIEKNRQYQLIGAAIDYCRKEFPHYEGEALGEITDAFNAGAEWEHNRFMEKACWWLRETAHFYVSDFTGELDDNILLEDFKKAMEE
jgi:hypothetical protein